MKLKGYLFSLLCIFSTALSAQWINIGNADYNWGPFHVYTISLYSENGQYEQNQTPLMLKFGYAKPIEGKSFAISLVKEMEALQIYPDKTGYWLKLLQQTLPDFSPNDVLSYIALSDQGYFILNDTVLESQFSPEFSHALAAIWLSPETNFKKLQPFLLGNKKGKANEVFFKLKKAPLLEENNNPELPPYYKIDNRKKLIS